MHLPNNFLDIANVYWLLAAPTENYGQSDDLELPDSDDVIETSSISLSV